MARVLLNAVIQVFILPDFNPLLRLTFRIEEGKESIKKSGALELFSGKMGNSTGLLPIIEP
ncbi:hypothetical protein [Xenorhabdus bovienii]|uniref:hypothetical protein n=1 Tax=Xenorhabdus bovienii TaxID=40576 RepID=UPI00237C8777|nr:hypothetical protein [Xenorhabdus bovienii]